MQFTENEIPFQTLDRLGLTREMIEDLPVRITNDILEGRRSPVLPIMVVDSDGNEVKSRSRFKLIRKEDGDVNALFYPEIEKADLRLFSEQNRALLEKVRLSLPPFLTRMAAWYAPLYRLTTRPTRCCLHQFRLSPVTSSSFQRISI